MFPHPSDVLFLRTRSAMTLESGTFVQLAGKPDGTYQVVSVDDSSESAWVRRWPLGRDGSPPFSVPMQQITAVELASR
jgi:hypothetical protein